MEAIHAAKRKKITPVLPAYQRLLDARVARAKTCPNTIPHLGDGSLHSAIYADKVKAQAGSAGEEKREDK